VVVKYFDKISKPNPVFLLIQTMNLAASNIRNLLENSLAARIAAAIGIFALLFAMVSLTPTPNLFGFQANVFDPSSPQYQSQPLERPAPPPLSQS
jgi:hypothetical protein